MTQKLFPIKSIVFNSRLQYFLLFFFSLTLVILGIVLLLIPLEIVAGNSPYVERIAPVVYWGGCIGLQTLFGQFLWRGKILNWRILGEWKKLFVVSGIVFGIFLAFSIWVTWTGIGLIPEKYGWYFPGTPIIFSQLFLAWLIGLPFIIWGNSIEKWLSSKPHKLPAYIRLDIIICLVLWLETMLVWLGEPVRKESYFTPPPTPPNFEYYPHSDSAIYDRTAQNILIGEGQSNKVVLRPLYVFFLAFLHAIGGQQYETVVFWQTFFLAVIPIFVYLLTTMVGGRSAGLISAILMIIRQKNAIALTNVIEVSHSKLLLSDVPMMALVILMLYIFINWLRRPHSFNYLGVMAGASLGLIN